MKIRELAVEWVDEAKKRAAPYAHWQRKEGPQGQVGYQVGLSECAIALTEALAELDAKLQDFRNYWLSQYPEDPGRLVAECILDAMAVAFEVPTKRVDDEDDSPKERIRNG